MSALAKKHSPHSASPVSNHSKGSAPGESLARRPEVLEYQADAIELEERKPPVLARLTLYVVLLAMGAAFAWAWFSNIDEIIVAPGRLITTEPMMIVQPLETSIIREIHVKPGDTVQRGQLLAELDSTMTAADTEQLRARILAYDAQTARLNSELADTAYVPPANATEDELIQGRLAAQRAASFAARLSDFDAQIAHAEATILAAGDEQDVLSQRLNGLKEIDEMRATLLDGGNGSRLALLEARDVSFDIQAALARVRGQQAEAGQLLLQLQAQRQNFIEDYRRLAIESLVEVMERRTSTIEELKKAELRQAMVTLVAPGDGAVLEIAQRSIGSVVQAAEPLFTLVPLNVRLEAEVSVAAADIGHLTADDPARIKFDAFPFQKHGTIQGKVVSISQDSFSREGAADGIQRDAAFYKIRLALGDVHLRALPDGFRLLPGMTIAAEINAGQRSVLSYFLYPLIRGLDEGLHEP